MRFVASSLMALPLLIAINAAQAQPANRPKPSEIKIFSDWAVACDNIRQCSAQALMQESEDWSTWLSLDIVREGGPTGFGTFNVSANEWPASFPAPQSVVFATNAGEKISMQRQKDDPQGWTMRLDADGVAKLRDAATLELKGADGRTHAKASLAGLTATLRYMDEQQGRVDGVTALIARGSKPTSAVPAVPRMPVVRAAKLSNLPPYKPTAAEWASLYKRSACTVETEREYFENTSYRLDATTTLLELPCSTGAYNMGTVYYIARKVGSGKAAKMRITPAPLDYDMRGAEKPGMAVQLVNSGFEPKTLSLSHYHKGRGIGDCGDSANWVWDGKIFRLVGLSAMSECRGSNNFLRLWVAEDGIPERERPNLNL